MAAVRVRRRGSSCLAGFCAALALTVAGCSSGTANNVGGTGNASPAAPATGTTRQIKIAYVTSAVDGWIQANIAGLKRGAGTSNVTVFNANFDPAKLNADLQTIAASKQYDAVAVVPFTGASVPAIKSVIAAGLKVATVLVPATDPASNQLIPGAVIATGEPYARTGHNMGALTIQACKNLNPCHVGLIIGSKAIPADQSFASAFQAETGQSANIKLVATGEGQFDPQQSHGTAQNMLSAHPDLNVLVTEADNMTGGAELAVKAAGKTGSVALLGHGASVQGCAAVKSGAWFGTTVSLPQTNGEVAGAALREAVLHGTLPADPTPDPVAAYPAGQTITHTNAAQCPAQWSQ